MQSAGTEAYLDIVSRSRLAGVCRRSEVLHIDRVLNSPGLGAACDRTSEETSMVSDDTGFRRRLGEASDIPTTPDESLLHVEARLWRLASEQSRMEKKKNIL